MDVWRLTFSKLSLSHDGVRGCCAPCSSILYVRSFFKNGIDLTVFVMLQVSMLVLLVKAVFINNTISVKMGDFVDFGNFCCF
jgi:hypothetical protein